MFKSNLLNQTNQNRTYQTKLSQPSLLNPTYQTKLLVKVVNAWVRSAFGNVLTLFKKHFIFNFDFLHWKATMLKNCRIGQVGHPLSMKWMDWDKGRPLWRRSTALLMALPSPDQGTQASLVLPLRLCMWSSCSHKLHWQLAATWPVPWMGMPGCKKDSGWGFWSRISWKIFLFAQRGILINLNSEDDTVDE